MDRKMLAKELVSLAKALTAIEFPSQEAYDEYLKEHPDADKSNHSVKKQEAPAKKEEPAKEAPAKKGELVEKVKEKVKYKGYVIEKSGFNYYVVVGPDGHRAFGEVPASVDIAKKWIDMDIREKGKKA